MKVVPRLLHRQLIGGRVLTLIRRQCMLVLELLVIDQRGLRRPGRRPLHPVRPRGRA